MLTSLILSSLIADASSHREAPGTAKDPTADLTDFYAFVSPEDASKVVFILNVDGIQLPGDGPNYHFFDDAAQYAVNIDNEGDGVADIKFVFEFETTYQYPDEFLYNLGDIQDPANLNRVQEYTVSYYADGVLMSKKAGNKAMVAPSNPGTQSDPNMGYDPWSSGLGEITAEHIHERENYRAFAGPRQEGFFVDLGRTFDLLNLAGNDPGANLNSLLGFNVSSIAIEVDASLLTKDGLAPKAGDNEVIASWSTVSRQMNLTRSTLGAEEDVSSGDWVQISRLGSPLVNEVVIPILDKDRFNASLPEDDAQFLSYVTDPILLPYMVSILGVTDPGCYSAGFGVGCREDLVQVFLTGHPALGTEPAGFMLGGPIPGEPGKVFGAFEALRLNLTVATSAYPNGRYVTDDVVDTSLSAEAGLLINGAVVSDGVSSEGLHYLNEFPFLGDPWQGDNHPLQSHEF